MKDHYGTPILYVEQGGLAYTVPNHGQLPWQFNEQAFYIYKLYTEEGVSAGCVGPFDPVQARDFARHNGLLKWEGQCSTQ